MEQTHLPAQRMHLFVGQDLRQEVVERLLPIENDPLVFVAIGEDLVVLEEHWREERRVAGPAKPMNPLVNPVVVLAKVHVRPVTRALRDHGVPIVEDEQVHQVGRHVCTDLAHLDHLPVIPVGIPGCGHDGWDSQLSHVGTSASYTCAA